MSIKVTFPVGSNAETVMGLYQWDIGQILEIESADIDSEIVEVHFACSNMNEAIVYPCTFVEHIGSVAIPDICLEQSSTITAWIYRINPTGGYYTAKTITLPITARIRPGVKRDIPTAVVDKYTELITEVNEAVGALKDGSVTVAQAKDATNAGHATSAGNAASASYATLASFLTTLPTENTEKKLTSSGLYNIQYKLDNEIFASGLVYWEQGVPTYCPSYTTYYNTNNYSRHLKIDSDGSLRVYQLSVSGGTSNTTDYTAQSVFYTSKLGG